MTARESLTREKVLHTALALVDQEGLDGLSMRRLAMTLNVQAMSLYNHVASKSDLLDGIAELVFDQVELPEPEMAWPEQVRAVALSMYRAFSRHLPVAVALVTDQANPATVRALEPFDRLAGALFQAGFDGRQARQALGAVTDLVFGSLLISTGGFTSDADGRLSQSDTSAYLRRVDPTRLPHFSRLLQQRVTDEPSRQLDFEQGLNMLITGLEVIANQT